METDRRVPWITSRVRCAGRAAKTVDDMAAFRCHHLRESPGVPTSARNCSTFRIDSSRSHTVRWTHVRHVVSSFMQASFIWSETSISCSRLAMPWKIFCDRLRYLALIALAAFIGDLAHIALDPRSQTPCIGASGGIAGIITFYALNFPRMRLAFLMRWGFVWFRWIRLPAWFVFVLWILFQIIGTLEQKAGMSSVSSAAHLGGAAVGVVAWLVWRKTNNESRMHGIAKECRNPNEKRLSFCVQHLVSGPRSLRLSRVCGINQ